MNLIRPLTLLFNVAISLDVKPKANAYVTKAPGDSASADDSASAEGRSGENDDPWGEESESSCPWKDKDKKLVLAFVTWRHGDRTPDYEEVALDPSIKVDLDKALFPYGMKALTNRGKQRGYSVGKYLKSRYSGFVSDLYLPWEMVMRTTDYARTKMTGMAALAALYPPPQLQKWNCDLDWQPIPYHTLPYDKDDLIYWDNCPKYDKLMAKVYKEPKIKRHIEEHQELFDKISEITSSKITTPGQIWYLYNLYQALMNANVSISSEVKCLMPELKDMTAFDFGCQTSTDELIRVQTGVLILEIVDAMKAYVGGKTNQTKLRFYSGHENTVANLMAAARVFEAHQPAYGSSFSIELWKMRSSEKYGVKAVYSPVAGGPGKALPFQFTDGKTMVDLDTFIEKTKSVCTTMKEHWKECKC